MKIYISGPITGTDDYLERFAAVEAKLAGKGHYVINPAKVNAAMPAGTSWEGYMAMSIAMLQLCDCIYLMDGWEHSRGANREMGYALAKGLKFMWEGKDE